MKLSLIRRPFKIFHMYAIRKIKVSKELQEEYIKPMVGYRGKPGKLFSIPSISLKSITFSAHIYISSAGNLYKINLSLHRTMYSLPSRVMSTCVGTGYVRVTQIFRHSQSSYNFCWKFILVKRILNFINSSCRQQFDYI